MVRTFFQRWLYRASVIVIVGCGDSNTSVRANTSSVESALNSGLSLLDVRLLQAGALETQDRNSTTMEFIMWDMEVLGQRLGANGRSYSTRARLFQDLSVYNQVDRVRQTFTWNSGIERPELRVGARYLLITTGRTSVPYPDLPERYFMIPIDNEGRTTAAVLGMSSGTPIGQFMPPDSLEPLLPSDAGTN